MTTEAAPGGLYDEFAPVGKEAWRALMVKELKSTEALQALYRTSAEGLELAPFYAFEDIEGKEFSPAAKAAKGWLVQERIKVENEADANAKALRSIEKGADAIVFETDKSVNSAELTNGISVPVTLRTYTYQENAANVSIQCDLFGRLLQTGSWEGTEAGYIEKIQNYNGSIEVNASLYHNAGAETCTQLAFALAHANEYLTLKGAEAAKNIIFNFSIGSDYFFEIAKFRAARRLWALLLEQYGVNADMNVWAETSLRNKTIYDYNNNLLRATTEVMSAAIGGSNAIYVYPYDVLFKNHNDFSERISRNIQLVARYESYLDRVEDAANGSFYIETITEEVAAKSWELFKDVESKGGWLACVKSGYIQDAVEKQADAAQQQADSGQKVILGVNKYPNKNEKMKGEIEISEPVQITGTEIKTLPLRRLAAGLENKRISEE